MKKGFEDMQAGHLARKHMHDRQSLYAKCLFDSFVPTTRCRRSPVEGNGSQLLVFEYLLFGHSWKEESSANLSA